MKYIKYLPKYLAAMIIGAIALNWGNFVSAQEIRTLEDYLEECIPESEDDELNPECERLQEKERDLDSEADKPERRIRERSPAEPEKTSDGIGGYAGITLGVFFPDIDESRGFFSGEDTEVDDAAFGSSIFAGVRFNRYLATDIELSGFVGDVDSDLDEDEDYSLGAFFLNPRFILPLGEKRNSLSLFLSPGLGVSQLTSSVEDEVDDFDRTTFIEDDTRFTWQIKGGVTVPVSSKFSILGQVRYASQTGDNAIDYLGTEVGVDFNF